MHLTSYLQDGRLIIELTGEIDHHSAKQFITVIIGKIEAYAPKLCALDFQNVTFMDSSGIAVIINALRYLASIGGKLMITGLTPQPKKVIQTSGIDKLVEIQEALL